MGEEGQKTVQKNKILIILDTRLIWKSYLNWGKGVKNRKKSQNSKKTGLKVIILISVKGLKISHILAPIRPVICEQCQNCYWSYNLTEHYKIKHAGIMCPNQIPEEERKHMISKKLLLFNNLNPYKF